MQKEISTSKAKEVPEFKNENFAKLLEESLKKDLSKLVIDGAEMILKKEIDKSAHDKAIKDLVNKI